jgi:MoaA/NifB/PqqE/SkfB family radical SAM enzyme
MGTKAAKVMLTKLQNAGVSQFVFAGGDPLIRPDIGELVSFAAEQGLRVEIQTNCQFTPKDFRSWLDRVHLIGVSLDGSTDSVHDVMRSKRGNFDKVIAMLNLLEERNIAYVVRSVVTKMNARDIGKLGDRLSLLRCLRKWSLLEFDRVGDGKQNSEAFFMTEDQFLAITTEIVAQYRTRLNIDVYNGAKKKGVYFLIRSDGEVYTSTNALDGDYYPTVGSILNDDISVILDRLGFDAERHSNRYEGLM